MRKILILGAGWLGTPLALHLVANSFNVTVTYRSNTTRKKLHQKNLPFVHVDLNEVEIPTCIYDTECLCILIPPSKNENYISMIEKITKNPKFCHIEQVIYTSSTSVYEDTVLPKDETCLTKENNTLREVEKILEKFSNTCILRMSGLMGGERFLAKYYKEKVLDSQNIVNHIHLQDAVAIIERVIIKKLYGIYNVSAPIHPTKEQILKEQCSKLNLKLPIFKENNTRKAVVLTNKIDKEITYMYQYPNPQYFL